jgi:hypothetical protein
MESNLTVDSYMGTRYSRFYGNQLNLETIKTNPWVIINHGYSAIDHEDQYCLTTHVFKQSTKTFSNHSQN